MPKVVLIVEDNPVHADMVKDVLETKDFATVLAKDSNEAMKSAREHRPNLIIMDIQLPGISGIEITKAIKADDDLKDIPIIAVTAFASRRNQDEIREAGCVDILTKPFSVPELFEIVVKYLGDPEHSRIADPA
jgi:two-component system, cell cycle response regulator DivK